MLVHCFAFFIFAVIRPSFSQQDIKGFYLGQSEVRLIFRRLFDSDFQQTSLALVIQFSIPETSHLVTCQLFANNGIIPNDYFVETVGEIFDNDNSKDDLCHFIGVASFSLSTSQTKCVVSICQFFGVGAVWLPGKDSQALLSFSFEVESRLSDHYLATFSLRGARDLHGLILGSSSRSSASAQKSDADELLRQLTVDKSGPNWYHLRLVYFVSVESFTSSALKSSRRMTASVLAATTNYVNAIWSQLNVSVYMRGLVIWSNLSRAGVEEMPSNYWNNSEQLMQHLAKIAEQRIWPLVRNADYIVAIRNLNQPPSLEAVGLSGRGSLCKGTAQRSYARGSILALRTFDNNDAAQTVLRLASTVSHEIGHIFGMKHDGDDGENCYCVDIGKRSCVMNTYTDNDIDTYLHWSWSNCSVAALKSFLKTLPPLCLKQIPPPRKLILGAVCGNGILEAGEECDCGLGFTDGQPPEHFRSLFCENRKCCNYTTCKLAQKAKCASGSCCESKSCSFSEATKLCRAKKSEICDFPELCPGNSSFCPDDRYLITGIPCDSLREGTCYQGECVSRSGHCKLIMGGSHLPLADVASCYLRNKNGGKSSNCGHDWFRTLSSEDAITPCNLTDIECGNIMCSSYDPSWPFVNQSVFHRSFTVFNLTRSSAIQCASIAGRMLPDFGHTPDGVLCAIGSGYCLNHRCVTPVPKCTTGEWCDNFGDKVERLQNVTKSLNLNQTSRRITFPPCLDRRKGQKRQQHLKLVSSTTLLNSELIIVVLSLITLHLELLF